MSFGFAIYEYCHPCFGYIAFKLILDIRRNKRFFFAIKFSFEIHFINSIDLNREKRDRKIDRKDCNKKIC